MTSWGVVPSIEKLLSDFPGVTRASNLDLLKQSLARWGGVIKQMGATSRSSWLA